MDLDEFEYKGYITTIRSDKVDNVLFGNVILGGKQITFSGYDFKEVEKAFQTEVDKYLASEARKEGRKK